VAKRPTWDEVWLEMTDVIGRRSLCSRAQVGAVIVTADNRVQAASYNGSAPKLPVDGPCIDWCPRAMAEAGTKLDTGYNDCYALHAESNAIARSDHTQLDGATIYVNGSVCMNCAKMITATRISRVVMRINPSDAHRAPGEVIRYLQECEISVVAYHV